MEFKQIIKKSKIITLLTTSGYNNVGQEATTSVIINNIKEINPKIIILANSNKPRETRLLNKDIKKVYFFKTIIFPIILFIPKTIILGGDEITSSEYDNYYNKFFQYFQAKFRIIFTYFSTFFNKNIILYKIGIYNQQRNFPIFMLKRVLEKSKIVIARDKYSKNYLERLTKKQVLLSKDAVYSLKINGNNIKKNKVGFILKRTNNIMIEKQIIHIINAEKQKRKIVFIIFSNHLNKYENDFNYTLNIIKKTKLKSYKIINEKDYKKLFIKMSRFKEIFSMRYHGCVFSEMLGVDFIAIPTSKKIEINFKEKII